MIGLWIGIGRTGSIVGFFEIRVCEFKMRLVSGGVVFYLYLVRWE